MLEPRLVWCLDLAALERMIAGGGLWCPIRRETVTLKLDETRQEPLYRECVSQRFLCQSAANEGQPRSGFGRVADVYRVYCDVMRIPYVGVVRSPQALHQQGLTITIDFSAVSNWTGLSSAGWNAFDRLFRESAEQPFSFTLGRECLCTRIPAKQADAVLKKAARIAFDMSMSTFAMADMSQALKKELATK